MIEIADGLRFPEGPIAMPDGSVILVEIARGALSRVASDGAVSVVADLGGGPNGAAMGPDGSIYVCNNGGFDWYEVDGRLFPGDQPTDYVSGRIDKVDPNTGEWRTLFQGCGDIPLKGPNDIVFDRAGGFYFTDLGKSRARDSDKGAVYYAQPDGSSIIEIVFPMVTPNGIGLSPREDELYVAETTTGRLWAFEVEAPGKLAGAGGRAKSRLIAGLPGHQLFDSLAVDAEGNVCVATLVNGGITSISPDGLKIEHFPMPDRLTTNICFGGNDLMTAFITLSSSGKLVSTSWPRAGLALNFLNAG
jgi:gluconolactonase